MDYTFVLPIYIYQILAVATVLAAIIAVWTLRRSFRVARATSAPEPDNDAQPGVSIIVYSNSDTANLRQSLPLLMAQVYPKFEVIVVDDSYTEHTKDFLLEASLEYHNLYHTYVPAGTENLSRRKLSLTLGIKAAKYEYIITTAGNCYPPDEHWLGRIMSHFSDGIEVVIGYSFINGTPGTGIRGAFRCFDIASTAVQYLSYAIKGNCYRGDANCLAYKRDLFFANKGYSRSLNLHYGDDDLFVNDITNSQNTAVAIAPGCQMRVETDTKVKTYRDNKLHYGFTARYIRTLSKYSAAAISWLRWLFVAAITAIGVLAYHSLVAIVAAFILLACLCAAEIVAYSKAGKALNCRAMVALAPLFALCRPIVNMRYKFTNYRLRKTNFTWQRRNVR